MNGLERRVSKLEGPRGALPWHLPIDRWTDAQLEAVMRDPVVLTDAQLEHIAAGGEAEEAT
jgi:hypothetical protein